MSAEAVKGQPLSPREIQVAECIADGLGNKQIAFKLNIKDGTVKQYVNIMFKKLGATNRTQVAVWFLARKANASAENHTLLDADWL